MNRYNGVYKFLVKYSPILFKPVDNDEIYMELDKI